VCEISEKLTLFEDIMEFIDFIELRIGLTCIIDVLIDILIILLGQNFTSFTSQKKMMYNIAYITIIIITFQQCNLCVSYILTKHTKFGIRSTISKSKIVHRPSPLTSSPPPPSFPPSTSLSAIPNYGPTSSNPEYLRNEDYFDNLSDYKYSLGPSLRTTQEGEFRALLTELRTIVTKSADEGGNFDMSGEGGVSVNKAISRKLQGGHWARSEATTTLPTPKAARPPAFVQNAHASSVITATILVPYPKPCLHRIASLIAVLLSMRGTEGVEVMENVLGEGEGEDNLDELLVGHVIDFLEAFVENAADRDKGNKETLKDVLGVMTGKGKGGKVTEEEVDEWMENNRGRFDACFLKHLDGEVRRVKKAKSTNPQNARTVEILNIIRVRVVEEAGRGLGEDAVVLEQVMSYESEEVR